MTDPIDAINRRIADTQKKTRNIQKQIAKSKCHEIERQERNNELLEINANQNEEMLELQRTELDFLKNIDGNTAMLVKVLEELEETNRVNGDLTQENMIVIKQRLDEIVNQISESKNVSQLFVEEAQKQIIEKGVSFGIQFIIMGLKLLFKANVVE